MKLDGIKDELNESEPCFIVKSGTSKVYIPKLMPLLKKCISSTITEHISLDLENASTCKPSFSHSVITKAYITAKKFTGLTYSSFVKGDRYLCSLINKDPNRVYIDNKKIK